MTSKTPEYEGERAETKRHGLVLSVEGNFDSLVWKCRDCGASARTTGELQKMNCE